MIKHQPCLQWVIVDGKQHHVSEFSDLKPKARPDAVCPVCRRPVIMRLGTIRAHHVAHNPGDICITTQPETAIHINSKYHLQKELSKSDEVQIWQKCNGWTGKWGRVSCRDESRKATIFAQGWDRVEVEWQIGPYRIDVALLSGDKVIGAIEVLVTHQCEDEKRNYFNKKNIPWIEIRVTEDFYSKPTAWKKDQPLTPEDYNTSIISPWSCFNCTSDAEASSQREEKLKEETEKHERQVKQKISYAQQFETLFVRYVDFYYLSGKKYRSVYVIQQRVNDGKVVYADLQEIGTQRYQVAVEYPPITEKSIEKLKQALMNELQKKKERGTIVDNSFDWRKKPDRFHPKMFIDPDRYPYKYWLNGNKWQKIEQPPKKRFVYFSDRLSDPNASISNAYRDDKVPGIRSDQSIIREPTFSFLDKEYPCRNCGQFTSDWVSYDGQTKTCLCRECSQLRNM